MKLSPAGKGGDLLIALLVFLVAFAPLGWLFARMRHEAVKRDQKRLFELSSVIRKALFRDAVNHQLMMQTWRKRIAAFPSPLDEKAWENTIKGADEARISRFRSVGYAVWDEENRLIVRFSESRSAGERITIPTDLAAIPEVLSALESESKSMRGMVVCAGPVALPGIGVRNLILTSVEPGGAERGVFFTTILAEDFLAPVRTVWKRRGAQAKPQADRVDEDYLPGVGERLVRIEVIPPGGQAPVGVLPEIWWNSGLGALHLVFHPGLEFGSGSSNAESWAVLGGGGFVALLLAILAWTQVRQRDLLRLQVATRTTESRESNAELGLYKAIIETTSDLVGLCEMDGTPIFMNRSGRAMLGISPDESLEAFPLDRIYPPEGLEPFASEGIPSAIENGFWSAEIQMRQRAGKELSVSFVGVAIKSVDGASLNLGFIARDITARQQLEARLRESLDHERELVAIKSQFVNTVSHEFRTPLGIILTSTDILNHYSDRLSNNDRREHLNARFIRKSQQRLKFDTLISDPAPLLALGISSREAEVLLWIARGKTNDDIAKLLGLSVQTVKKHVSSILVALGVENRSSAAMRALETLADAR